MTELTAKQLRRKAGKLARLAGEIRAAKRTMPENDAWMLCRRASADLDAASAEILNRANEKEEGE